MLFNIRVFWNFPAIFLIPIPSSMWSEGRCCMIPFFKKDLLRCVLCPRMWSFLVNVPCELERKVHPAVLRGSSQEDSNYIHFFDDAVEFSHVFTDFSLPHMSTSDRWVLNSPYSSSGFVCFSLKFHQFLSHAPLHSHLAHTH